jgi:hypothetical protein
MSQRGFFTLQNGLTPKSLSNPVGEGLESEDISPMVETGVESRLARTG